MRPKGTVETMKLLLVIIFVAITIFAGCDDQRFDDQNCFTTLMLCHDVVRITIRNANGASFPPGNYSIRTSMTFRDDFTNETVVTEQKSFDIYLMRSPTSNKEGDSSEPLSVIVTKDDEKIGESEGAKVSWREAKCNTVSGGKDCEDLQDYYYHGTAYVDLINE